MKTIKWGIIGCGNVTEVKSGPAFKKVPKSDLVAVMRRNADKAADYAARHSVGKWYASADDLINDPQVNAIYIATPPDSHEEYTRMAIYAGKPVYVEKPMTLNAQSAKAMVELANSSDIKLCVAHYRRQQPLFKKVKELLANNTIGKVRSIDLKYFQSFDGASVQNNWRLQPSVSGGGLFHDLAPHQLDLMVYFFGEPISSSGTSVNLGGYYNAADTVNGEILFANDIKFRGQWSFVMPEAERCDRCEIIGDDGSISFPVFEHKEIEVSFQGNIKVIRFESLMHVQQPMIEAVVKYFLDEGENPCSGEEGAKVMSIIDSFGHE